MDKEILYKIKEMLDEYLDNVNCEESEKPEEKKESVTVVKVEAKPKKEDDEDEMTDEDVMKALNGGK